MRTHRKFIRLINLRIDGRLTPADRELLEEHLAGCETCRMEYETLESMKRILSKTREVADSQRDFERRKENIMRLVRNYEASRDARRRRPIYKPVLATGSIIAILLLSVILMKQPKQAGRSIFDDPADRAFVVMMMNNLNDHEITGAFEAFGQTPVIAFERKTNAETAKKSLK